MDTRLPRPDGQLEALLRTAFQAVARTLFYRHVPPPRVAPTVSPVRHETVPPATDGHRTN